MIIFFPFSLKFMLFSALKDFHTKYKRHILLKNLTVVDGSNVAIQFERQEIQTITNLLSPLVSNNNILENLV